MPQVKAKPHRKAPANRPTGVPTRMAFAVKPRPKNTSRKVPVASARQHVRTLFFRYFSVKEVRMSSRWRAMAAAWGCCVHVWVWVYLCVRMRGWAPIMCCFREAGMDTHTALAASRRKGLCRTGSQCTRSRCPHRYGVPCPLLSRFPPQVFGQQRAREGSPQAAAAAFFCFRICAQRPKRFSWAKALQPTAGTIAGRLDLPPHTPPPPKERQAKGN